MPLFNNSWSTPVSWKENNEGLVGLLCARRFTAFGLADGKAAWWVDGIGYQACATPIVASDRLVVLLSGPVVRWSRVKPN